MLDDMPLDKTFIVCFSHLPLKQSEWEMSTICIKARHVGFSFFNFDSNARVKQTVLLYKKVSIQDDSLRTSLRNQPVQERFIG